MIKNSLMKFIDSCVGNIARKIEDEFRESDHPRDKGGKFTSKGNEGRGGGKQEKSSSRKTSNGRGDDWMSESYEKEQLSTGNEGIDLENELMGEDDTRTGAMKQAEHYKNTLNKPYLERVSPELAKEARTKIHQALEDDIRQIAENSADKEEFKINLDAFLEDYVQDDMADTDERAMDNFGYDKETVHAVAEEMKGEIDSIADDFFEEDNDSVTGPEDRDYMNEEEEDDENSASKDVKSVRSAIDEELFELATTSESEEEFKSKVKRRFDQYRRLLKDDRTNELPVGGKRAEYALKKIQSEIDSGTSEYW